MKPIIKQTPERQQAIADGFNLSVAFMEGSVGDGTLDMLADWCELLNGFDDNDFLFKIIDEPGFSREDYIKEYNLVNQTYCARCITKPSLPDLKMVVDDGYEEIGQFTWEQMSDVVR
jgi:hypothetical protein